VVEFENSTTLKQFERAVVESGFHHIVDYNCDTTKKCPSFLEEPAGDDFKQNLKY
jgi:hypothetical protein